ncbi:hypothetical protein [Chryseobacterium schmidteae]|uniref:hypothetical protein n=1 Tax=Chryseobacterium schmidteae TaxID=2730404 RepID=UPI00158D54D9|nr:hypothetical protein [Chryseobacterium schmidteae]
MKQNAIFFIILIVFFTISCRKDKDSINTEQRKDSISQITTPSAENPNKNQVRHFFSANGGSVLYLKNGDVKGQARFDTDGDFITELLKTQTYDTYRESDNYLIQGNKDTIQFFDDFGKIDESWNILKGEPVKNKMQVISYKNPERSRLEQTENVAETRLIIFSPEYKTFKDENSEEAENYFTAMDDWNFYTHELNEQFEKLGIKTVYLKKPYLKLKIGNNKSIVINTHEKINNYNTQALFYKKGKKPIVIHLIFSDNNLEEIKEYLKN